MLQWKWNSIFSCNSWKEKNFLLAGVKLNNQWNRGKDYTSAINVIWRLNISWQNILLQSEAEMVDCLLEINTQANTRFLIKTSFVELILRVQPQHVATIWWNQDQGLGVTKWPRHEMDSFKRFCLRPKIINWSPCIKSQGILFLAWKGDQEGMTWIHSKFIALSSAWAPAKNSEPFTKVTKRHHNLEWKCTPFYLQGNMWENLKPGVPEIVKL